MRKAWKIAGIVLGSLVAVVAIVAALLVYVVFTPARLTPVVTQVADNYIRCAYKLGKVDLTFFSTFPEFGLRADSILIINPVEGAQSDTLLCAKKVVARIDVEKLLNQGELSIHEVALQDVVANVFIGTDTTNFDILALEPDTTQEDTASAPLIKTVSLDNMTMSLNGRVITFVDQKDTISAKLQQPTITFNAKQAGELVKGNLDICVPSVSVGFKGEDYAADADIRLKTPFELDLKMESLDSIERVFVSMHDAQLQLNQFNVQLAGDVQVIPSIDVDAGLQANNIRVSELLKVVPKSIFEMPKDIKADANVFLTAHVEGQYNDSTFPLVDGHLRLTDAEGSIASLPYVLTNVEGDADFHLDLNDEPKSYAVIDGLYAETKQSNVTITGRVDDLLGKMLLDLVLDVDLNIPDAQYFLPDNITAAGKAKGRLAAKIALDDLADVKLEKGIINADLALDKFTATYDSMLIRAPKGQLAFHVPNQLKANPVDKKAVSRRKNIDFLNGTLSVSGLEVKEDGNLQAALGKTDIALQVSNVISSDPVIYADVALKTEKLDATVEMSDSTGRPTPANVRTQQPDVKAYVEYDTKDASKIPTLDCLFAMNRLEVDYDTIKAHLCAPKGNAAITGGRRDKTQPRLRASLNADDVEAKMGSFADASTGKMKLSIAAQHTDNKENILLEWRPRLSFDLEKAVANLSGLEPQVRIPACKFSYSNKDFHIDTARVELSHSDFSLSGDVHNVGPWLENKGLLTGELNFISTYADVDELLGYLSGMGSDEEAPVQEAKTSDAKQDESTVFLVPKGVDLTLNTHIVRASAFDQNLRSLGGMVYIRDGVLVIEEMGFICDAARLQLTALYKTPRRNHIFAGFDYHMTNINVEELVNMIPQVDSLLPMLRSFRGAANFHLAGETYLNDRYEIKESTTRGAMSIDAKDLTLLDGEVFSKIAKLLTFKKKTENKIDSISAEVALYKGEIDIYPFLISCDKWMGAVGGTHNLDGTMDYNINVLNPVYLGVHVGGNLNTFEKLTDLDIKLTKCVYAKDFKPMFRREVDTQAADIRKMIKQALEKNVKQ